MGFSMDDATTAEVLRQVEFYFSDSNLPGDRFLRQRVQESSDGFVSLPLICSFGRMKNHLKIQCGPDTVPADVTAAVAEVLRKSTFLKVSEDGKKVGRVTPISKLEEVQAAIEVRSIVAGPLRWTVTFEEIEKLFSKHAKVNSVHLPRHPSSKMFCGSAIIELASEDEAKKLLESKISYDGVELELKSKKDFDVEMDKYAAQHREELKNRRNTEMEYPKGLILAFTLHKVGAENEKSSAQPEGDSKQTNEAETKESQGRDSMEDDKVKETNGEANGKDNKEGPEPMEEETKEEKPQEDQSTKDSGEETKVEEKENENQIQREDLRDSFQRFGNLKYVDFTRGATSGYLRFEKPEEVTRARTAAVLAESGGILVKDHVAILEAVEGEAEREYWVKLKSFHDKRIENGRGRGSSRGGRGRGGRGRDGFQRDNWSRGRGGKQQNNGEKAKVDRDVKLGKHQRFEDDGGEEHPPKQVKTDGAS